MTRSLTVTWEDPLATFEEGKKLPKPLDYLRALVAGKLPAPPIAKLLSMDLVEVEEGKAVFSLTPAEQHYNPIGVVHGGIAFTMLDSAMGCCVQTLLPAGKGYTTLEIKANLAYLWLAHTYWFRVPFTGIAIATACFAIAAALLFT